MVALRWAAAALFVASIPIFLVLSNVRIATTELLTYHYAFARYDAPKTTGVSRPELDRAALQIVDYLSASPRDSLLDIRVKANGDDVALFNPREVLHMRDVRDLMQMVWRIHEFAFAYAVSYVAAVFLWSRERSMRRLARQIALGGALTAGLLAVAALAVLVGFDTLFTQFHVLSFSNDFWQLDPARDHLVQMFPQGFWFDVTLGVGLISVLEGAALAAAGIGYLAWLDRDRGNWRARWPLVIPRW